MTRLPAEFDSSADARVRWPGRRTTSQIVGMRSKPVSGTCWLGGSPPGWSGHHRRAEVRCVDHSMNRHACLVPLRLPDPQDEPHRLECRHVRGLVARVDDGQVDVDHRLGGEARDAGRPDVLQSEDPISEGVTTAVPASTSNTAGQAGSYSTTAIGAAGGGSPTHGSSSGSASSCRVISSFVATTVHLPVRRSRSYGVLTAPGRSTPVVAEPIDEGRGQPFRQDRGTPLADGQHRRVDRRARAERVPADRRAEFELPPRRPSRRPQRDGRRRRVPAGDLGLQHQVGPVGPASGPIEEQRQQLGGDPERWVRHDAVRLLREREPANVGLDHPHPIARPDGSKSIAEAAGPYRIGFDRPDAYAGRDDRTRQRARPGTDLDDEFTRFESERVDESLDQRRDQRGSSDRTSGVARRARSCAVARTRAITINVMTTTVVRRRRSIEAGLRPGRQVRVAQFDEALAAEARLVAAVHDGHREVT